MGECIIHYNIVLEQNLVKLSSETSWKTLLQAAERRNFMQPILDISSTVTNGEYPSPKYDKTCRSMFTLKRDLVVDKKSEKQVKHKRIQGVASD